MEEKICHLLFVSFHLSLEEVGKVNSNETSVWLRMISRAKLIIAIRTNDLIDENQQLCRILNATSKTTKRNQTRPNQMKNDR